MKRKDTTSVISEFDTRAAAIWQRCYEANLDDVARVQIVRLAQDVVSSGRDQQAGRSVMTLAEARELLALQSGN